MRKKRKVRSVMGWLLSFQLREPGAGVCCAFSMGSGTAGEVLIEARQRDEG